MTTLSLYSHLLGAAFDRLPPILKDMHDARVLKHYAGMCHVTRGQGWVVRAIARFARLPPPDPQTPITITIERSDAGETWTRHFRGHEMRSVLHPRHRMLEERLGAMALSFELLAEANRIVWSLRSARLIFVPLPISWFAPCAASETVADGRYCFDVAVGIRGIGLIVHYKGWLVERVR
jgi:hypothetical protein